MERASVPLGGVVVGAGVTVAGPALVCGNGLLVVAGIRVSIGWVELIGFVVVPVGVGLGVPLGMVAGALGLAGSVVGRGKSGPGFPVEGVTGCHSIPPGPISYDIVTP